MTPFGCYHGFQILSWDKLKILLPSFSARVARAAHQIQIKPKNAKKNFLNFDSSK